MKNYLTRSVALFFAAFSFSSAWAATSPTLTDLDIGYEFSSASDVSNGGTIIGDATVFSDYSTSQTQAFKYKNGVLTHLGFLESGNKSFASGISDDESVIAGHSGLTPNNYDFRAFKYSNGVMTNLGTLGGNYSRVSSISGDGSTIVGESYDSGMNSRAFKYVGSTMTDLGDLGGGESSANGVSYDGSVIVGQSNATAFKYFNGVMTSLGTLGGTYSSAQAVSEDGLVIVGYSHISGPESYFSEDGIVHAFKHSGGVMTSLGTLGGNKSYAWDVSRDGSVIVGQANTSDGKTHAFKYSNGVMTDLGTLGGDSSYAYGVSPDGTKIVGNSYTGVGVESHAFIYSTTLVDIDNTNTALYYNAAQLGSLMNLKNALLKYSLTQDCNKFGAKNMCLSVGYRYTNVDRYNAQENATNLKFAYRVTPNLRVGTMLDQAFSSNDPQNFTVRNSQPLVGVFANISQHPNESGLNLKLSAAYHNSKIFATRLKLANTESGVGSTSLKSSGLFAELSYAAKVSDKLQVRPFAAFRQTTIVRDGYAESSGADFPIIFNSVKQKFNTAILGARAGFEINKSLGINFGVGVEHNLRSRTDGYTGTISEIGTFNLASPNMRKTTKFVEAGFNYNISETKGLSGGVGYSTQVLNAAKATVAYLNYSVGF